MNRGAFWREAVPGPLLRAHENNERKISEVDTDSAAGAKRLEPLFRDAEEYRMFRQRHDNAKIARGDISKAEGPLFIGIDAGSTTTKGAVIDRDKKLLYSFYKGNEGNPLATTREMLKEIYSLSVLMMPCVTLNPCPSGLPIAIAVSPT